MPYKDADQARAASRRSYLRQDANQRARKREQSNAAMKRWYHKSPENRAKVAERRSAWKDANREWVNFDNSLRRRGITLDQYHAMNERQDFACAICREDRRLVIDHCHSTGRVRGLLCVACNGGIGALKESAAVMASALRYLGKAS